MVYQTIVSGSGFTNKMDNDSSISSKVMEWIFSKGPPTAVSKNFVVWAGPYGNNITLRSHNFVADKRNSPLYSIECCIGQYSYSKIVGSYNGSNCVIDDVEPTIEEFDIVWVSLRLWAKNTFLTMASNCDRDLDYTLLFYGPGHMKITDSVIDETGLSEKTT